MKVLILYDTKYGFTKKCARYLHDKIPGSSIFKISDNYDIMDFDRILLGTYIYLGEVSDTVAKFLKEHKHKLLDKELGLFCSALNKIDYLSALQESINAEIFYHAKIVLSGGKVEFEDLNFLKRRKLKKRINIIESTEEFYPDELDELIEFK